LELHLAIIPRQLRKLNRNITGLLKLADKSLESLFLTRFAPKVPESDHVRITFGSAATPTAGWDERRPSSEKNKHCD
jgi:hypothetical protein